MKLDSPYPIRSIHITFIAIERKTVLKLATVYSFLSLKRNRTYVVINAILSSRPRAGRRVDMDFTKPELQVTSLSLITLCSLVFVFAILARFYYCRYKNKRKKNMSFFFKYNVLS